MISRPTVLFVGAGVLKPYGFPVGRELIEKLVAITQTDAGRRFLADSGHTEKEAHSFGLDLERSHLASVDSFLQSRREYGAIAKTSIAAVLMGFESPAKIQHRLQSPVGFFEYLFNALVQGATRIEQNALVIATTNYDRAIEFALATALSHTTGMPFGEALSRCEQAIPVVHLHGSLGSLGGAEAEGGLPYGTPADPAVAATAGARIVTLGEPGSEAAYESLQKHMFANPRVHFVGFAYHQDVLNKVGTSFWRMASFTGGSRLGLAERERMRVSEYFRGTINFAGAQDDALEYLRAFLDID